MRKTFVILLCIALAIAVTACGSKTDDVKDVPAPLPPPPQPPVVEEPEPTPEAPEAPPQAAPAEDDVTIIDGTEVFKGQITGKATVELTGVKCNMNEKKLTFTLENHGEKNWQLNQEVPFPPPMDLGQVKLIMNNYEMNGRGKIYYTTEGVRMFGPNEKFSDNCGGVEVLAPGEKATCTLTPISIVGGADHEQTTKLLIDTPGGSTVFTFQCGA